MDPFLPAMPILHNAPVRFLTDAQFDELDEVVMRCAYASQNKLGRLCEEAVCENDLAARLHAEGFGDVRTQVPVAVSFRGFEKVYRLDLIVQGMIYELKAEERLGGAHDAQVYHYGALVQTDRIKLLNFGGVEIDGKLRRCPFRRTNRFATEINRRRWKAISDRCGLLAETAEACLREWGGFLDGHLFEEALIHFNGGEAGCMERLPVTRDGLSLGHHRVALHGEQVGFVVTSLDDGRFHERHLRSLLDCLPLQAWQWINIRGTTMSMVTIET
jgi:GxxExxY protein